MVVVLKGLHCVNNKLAVLELRQNNPLIQNWLHTFLGNYSALTNLLLPFKHGLKSINSPSLLMLHLPNLPKRTLPNLHNVLIVKRSFNLIWRQSPVPDFILLSRVAHSWSYASPKCGDSPWLIMEVQHWGTVMMFGSIGWLGMVVSYGW